MTMSDQLIGRQRRANRSFAMIILWFLFKSPNQDRVHLIVVDDGFHSLMTVPKMPTNSTFTIKEATNKRYSCWLSRDAFVNLSNSRLRLRLQGDKLRRLLAIFQSSLHCGLITQYNTHCRQIVITHTQKYDLEIPFPDN